MGHFYSYLPEGPRPAEGSNGYFFQFGSMTRGRAAVRTGVIWFEGPIGNRPENDYRAATQFAFHVSRLPDMSPAYGENQEITAELYRETGDDYDGRTAVQIASVSLSRPAGERRIKWGPDADLTADEKKDVNRLFKNLDAEEDEG